MTNRIQQLQILGVEPYPVIFDQRGTLLIDGPTFSSRFETLVTEEEDSGRSHEVSVAGRIYAVRHHGNNLIFLDLHGRSDSSQRIQVKIHRSTWQDPNTSFDFLTLELREGDIYGFVGYPCRSRRGELSLAAQYGQLLCPHLRDIPRQLDNGETRFRMRSLDLIVHESSRNILIQRSRIIREIRRFCEDQLNLIEVETPILQVQANGAAARPFRTSSNSLRLDLFLRIAPELYLKMLIIGGLPGVFEIGRQFRNEDIDHTHNPEFTSIELYWPYHDYFDLMNMTEILLALLIRCSSLWINGTNQIQCSDGPILDFLAPFRRISIMDELRAQYAILQPSANDFPRDDQLDTTVAHSFFNRWCSRENIECQEPRTTVRLLDRLIGRYVESQCTNPTFLIDHPQIMSPLARPHRSRPGLTERFELFIRGVEYANAYTELNDPQIQRQQFQIQQRVNGSDDETPLPDDHYCQMMEYGLPPTAGLGIGIDRLVMLLTGQTSIREVLSFPTLRPLDH